MIWVYAETVDGVPRPISLELLTKARSLGEVTAVALGPGSVKAADQLGAHGAKKVLVHEDAAFRDLLAVPAVDLLATLIEKHKPELILFGMTYEGRDIASRLSARLGTALIANATDLERKGEGYSVISPVFGGSLLVTTVPRTSATPLVLVRPKAFAAEPGGEGKPEIETLTEPVSTSKAPRVVRREKEKAAGPRLEDAAVIVSGGRGLGSPENFGMLEELAAELGAAVGASRAVVDAGWKPYSMQIGQTGKTVKPTVYIAVGISGAMQHTVGMKGAKTIVAINKDPEAPIFKLADLGIVGDVHKVVPQLIEEVRARKRK
ncbi:MAG TPA: electron transfer flavoprotein subunit alpha/FixB family protein [Candidatus Dormibacteraeota bacterium]|jgi:electron transfer flavoprotein alpha subunit